MSVTNQVVQILRHGGIAVLSRTDRPDDLLLDLFVRQRDHDAFAMLAERHGPMVLGVCRRVLRNSADADDAFQATFLVLALKAARIGKRTSLAPWLHGVAYNTARRLKRTIMRREVRETPLAEVTEPCANVEPELNRELLAILDEEITRLPERYRLPIVLCDLQGSSRKQAAQLLGWPEGTVAGRLARARTLLSTRLRQRGLASTSVVLGALLSDQLATAISPVLSSCVTRASATGLAKASAMGLVSTRVANATVGVVKAMFLQKLKTAMIALLLLGLAIVSAAGIFRGSVTAQTEPDRFLANAQEAKAELRKPGSPAGGKKIVTVVPLKKLNAKDTAKTLMELFPASVTVAAARDENTLIIYANEAETEDVFKILGIAGEERPHQAAGPARPGGTTGGNSPGGNPNDLRLKLKYGTWDEILKQYGEVSGLGAMYTIKPEGKGKLAPPVESIVGRSFSLGELTDVINKALLVQELILIRGVSTFTIVSTDERIPSHLIPHVKIDELSNWGKTEIVEVDIPVPERLKGKIESLTPELQKLLTPFGRIVYARGKQLTVIDTVANIKRLATHIGSPIVLRKYSVPGGMTDVFAKSIQADYPSLQILPVPSTNEILVLATEEEHQEIEKKLAAIKRKLQNLTVQVINLASSDPSEMVSTLTKLMPSVNTPGGPVITAQDGVQPGILVKGTLDQIDEVQKAVHAIEGTSEVGPKYKQIPIIPLANPPIPPDGTSSGGKRAPSSDAKKFPFTMRDVPWNEVFEWYARTSGLAVGSSEKPRLKGRFSFIPPEGKKFTLQEITDFINEELMRQGYLLVRKASSFIVHPADEMIDQTLARSVDLSNLAGMGNSELVRVVIPLPAKKASDMSPELRKMTSPFGSISTLEGGEKSYLVVIDIASRVRRIVQVVRGPGADDMPELTPRKNPADM